MRAFIISIAVFFVLSTGVIAQNETEEPIFDGEVFTNNATKIDNNDFTFYYDDATQKSLINIIDSLVIVGLGDCGTRRGYRVCIDSANLSSKNIVTWEMYYKMDVRVYKVTPELAVERTMEIERIVIPSDILQGEKAEVTILISNPSNDEVTDIRYSDDFTQFDVSELTGCQIKNGYIRWEGSLKPKTTKKCTFKISAYIAADTQITANLSYNDGFSIINLTSDPLKITVQENQLKVDVSNITTQEPGIQFDYTLILENINDEDTIDVQPDIVLPGYISAKKLPDGFWTAGDSIKANFMLKPNDVRNITFTLVADSSGALPVINNFVYRLKGVKAILNFNKSLDIMDIKPNVTVLLSDITEPNQQFVVAIDIKNPSRYHTMDNIVAELTSGFSEPIRAEHPSLAPNESYRLISNVFIAPTDIDEKEYSLNLRLTTELFKVNKFDMAIPIGRKKVTVNETNAGNLTGINEGIEINESLAIEPESNLTNATTDANATKEVKEAPETIVSDVEKESNIKMILLILPSLLIVALLARVLIKRGKEKAKKWRASKEVEKEVQEIAEIGSKEKGEAPEETKTTDKESAEVIEAEKEAEKPEKEEQEKPKEKPPKEKPKKLSRKELKKSKKEKKKDIEEKKTKKGIEEDLELEDIEAELSKISDDMKGYLKKGKKSKK